MKIFRIAFTVVFLPLAAFPQTPAEVIADLRKTPFLEASSEYAEALFRRSSAFIQGNPASHQTFIRENDNILVQYSTTDCSQEHVMWNAPRGTITQLSYFPKERIMLPDLSLDLTGFDRQNIDPQNQSIYVLFNKAKGIAIHLRRRVVTAIIIFPDSSFSARLCQTDDVQAYYKARRWSFYPIDKRTIVDYNLFPTVNNISIVPVVGKDGKFSVLTEASDPENDPLTYVYKVEAGEIVGSGKNVIWDLTGVPKGKYEIIAAVDDGCGLCGKYKKSTIEIE